MALFRNRKPKNDVLPEEVRDYFQAEKRQKTGVAWLLAIATLLVTFLIAALLFMGGRWAYRAIFGNDKKAVNPASQQTPSNTAKPAEQGSPASSGSSTNNSGNTSSGGQTSSTSTSTPSTSTPSTTPNTGPGATELINTGPGDE